MLSVTSPKHDQSDFQSPVAASDKDRNKQYEKLVSAVTLTMGEIHKQQLLRHRAHLGKLQKSYCGVVLAKKVFDMCDRCLVFDIVSV